MQELVQNVQTAQWHTKGENEASRCFGSKDNYHFLTLFSTSKVVYELTIDRYRNHSFDDIGSDRKS